MSDPYEFLQTSWDGHQQALLTTERIIAESARKTSRLAAVTKIVTIALGAFGATNAVATEIFGEDNVAVIVIYAAASLAIAAIAGLETAFRFADRSSTLRSLAAEVLTTRWRFLTEWRKIGSLQLKSRVKAASSVLDEQVAALTDCQKRAAEAGVNIISEVKESRPWLFRDQAETDVMIRRGLESQLESIGFSLTVLRLAFQVLHEVGVMPAEFLAAITAGEVDAFIDELIKYPQTSEAGRVMRALIEGKPPAALVQLPSILSSLTPEQSRRLVRV